MDTEIDEVYVAHIKSMFDHFDDEIIWSAIYEHGFDKNGKYNIEEVINYLLELSDSQTPINTVKNNNMNNINEVVHTDVDDTTNEDDTNDDDDDDTNSIMKIITSIPNLFSYGQTYEKLKQNDE